jgi:hypothetical protein
MTPVIRLVIVLIAGYALWEFSDALSLTLAILVKPQESRWFNVLSALRRLKKGGRGFAAAP